MLFDILKEMCERVDANYDQIDFTKDNWYLDYTWSKEDEEDFRKWLVNYLYNSVKGRKNVYIIVKQKQICLF